MGFPSLCNLHQYYTFLSCANFFPSPNLWRVGDNLYDLSGYLDSHPGGRQWLELTRGTDITEAFHVAHVFLGRAEAAMEKYKVGPCPKDVPRRSWFTFEKDGFYLKFKARAAKVSTVQHTYLLIFCPIT